MAQKVKVFLCGIGEYGYGWINDILNSNVIELAGIVEINKNRIKQASTEFPDLKDKIFTSLKEAKSEVNADAVFINTSPSSHHELAIEAINLGMDVAIAKPMADTMENANKIIQAIKKTGRIVIVEQTHRWMPIMRTFYGEVKKMGQKSIGHISINFFKACDFGKKDFRTKMKHPLLLDMAIHHFDMLRYIAGAEPVEVYAKEYNPKWSWYKQGASVKVIFTFKSGMIASYNGCWVSGGEESDWVGDWRVQFKNTALVIHKGKLYKGKGGKWGKNAITKEIKVKDTHNRRELFLEDFARAVRKRRSLICEAEDNIKSLNMVFKAIQSAETGLPVKI